MPDTIEIKLKTADQKIDNLYSGQLNKLSFQTKMEASVVEMEDINFHFDSAVLLPDYGSKAPQPGSEDQNRITGLAVLYTCYKHSEKNNFEPRILIAGHTDKKGGEFYNLTLSQKRAENVYFMFAGKRIEWVNSSLDKNRVVDVWQILKWVSYILKWDCDPGAKTESYNAELNNAILKFQERYNLDFVQLQTYKEKFSRNFIKIDEDGKMGKQTWGAFFDVYSLELLNLMESTEEELNELRGKLNFIKKTQNHPSPVVGCGECFPASGSTKEEENATDRRVEILFFNPGEEPILECHPKKFTCIKSKCDVYPKNKFYKHIPIPAKKVEPAVEFTYKMKIYFLGSKHIPHTQHYRCNYDLEEVPKKEVKPNDEMSASEFRILIHDNHAIKDSDSNTLLGSGGDATSKPKYYNDKNWARDITPAIPIRIEIRKIKDGNEVEIDPTTLYINLELSDPSEDFSEIDKCMNPARPKEWIEKFVKAFKRLPDDDTSKEDDNAIESFDGLRKQNKTVSPSSVLFGITSPIQNLSDTNSRITIIPGKDKNDKPIGFAEVSFIPKAIGGDNYQFLFTLTDKGNKKLKIVDDNQSESENLKTGKFTVWRKVTIDLLVTTDNTDLSYINWDLVNKSYNASFIEVVQPSGLQIKKYNEAEWKATVKAYFKDDVGNPSSAVLNDNSKYEYSKYFLPDFTSEFTDDPDDWSWTHGEALAKIFLKKAYKEAGKKNPRNEDKNQDVTPGLYMFLCKRLRPDSSALGMYMGDREFFMVTVGDATCTFTHEMGHAVFLRHSLIRFDSSKKVSLDISNKNWLDHDQNDAIACTMSYSNDYYGSDGKTVRSNSPVEWHFCSICLLTLRYYDRVKMSADSKVQKLICESLKPIQITDNTYNTIPGASIEMKKNAFKDFKALSKAEGIVNNHNIDYKKDLTSAKEGKWISDNPAIADFTTFTKLIGGSNRTFSGRLKGKNGGTGKIKIHYEIGTVSSEPIEVDITD